MKMLIAAIIVIFCATLTQARLLESKNDSLKYGRFEVRLRIARADGLVQCFVLIEGKDDTTRDWHEIDVEMTCNHTDKVESGIHIRKNIEGVKKWRGCRTIYPYELHYDYHTFTLDWTPDTIAWGMDGTVFRRSFTLSDGTMRDVQYDMGGPDCSTRDTIVSEADNYVKILKNNAFLKFEASSWKRSSDWAGIWDSTSYGTKPMFMNWFKYYRYTPGQGPNGSDFTLEYEDDFNNDQWNQDWWIVDNPGDLLLRDGKAIFIMNAGGVDGYDGSVPADPADENSVQVTAQPASRSFTPFAVRHDGISLTLENDSRVDAALFDLCGRRVRTLFGGMMKAGVNSIPMDSRTLPAGTYLVQINDMARPCTIHARAKASQGSR